MAELKPCRVCGEPARVENFPATPHRADCDIWMCSQHTFFGGACTSDTAYLTADAWNDREEPLDG